MCCKSEMTSAAAMVASLRVGLPTTSCGRMHIQTNPVAMIRRKFDRSSRWSHHHSFIIHHWECIRMSHRYKWTNTSRKETKKHHAMILREKQCKEAPFQITFDFISSPKLTLNDMACRCSGGWYCLGGHCPLVAAFWRHARWVVLERWIC